MTTTFLGKLLNDPKLPEGLYDDQGQLLKMPAAIEAGKTYWLLDQRFTGSPSRFRAGANLTVVGQVPPPW